MYDLTDDYLADVYRRARRHQGSWTGTAGALAADCWRLLEDRKRMKSTIADLERQLAELRAIDTQGPLVEPEQDMTDDDLEPVMGSSGGLEAAWAGIKARHQAMHNRIVGGDPAARTVYSAEEPAEFRVIGITGRAGAGKTTLASLVPGAVVMQFADPLYAAVAALTGLPEAMLRHPLHKGRIIPWLGKTPRQLLQTMGTEWGRAMVREDVWLVMARRRIEAWRESGASTVIVADVRFDNECQFIRDDMGGQVWGVFRSGKPDDGHSSEAGVHPSLVDLWLPNNGSLEDLRLSAASALAGEMPVRNT